MKGSEREFFCELKLKHTQNFFVSVLGASEKMGKIENFFDFLDLCFGLNKYFNGRFKQLKNDINRNKKNDL